MRKTFTPLLMAILMLLSVVTNSVDAAKLKVAYITATGLAGKGAAHPDSLDVVIQPWFTANHTLTMINAGAYTATVTPDSVKNLLKGYDLVVCSESVGGTNKLGVALKNIIGYKPFLNFKAYFYTVSGRWGWAAPTDGAAKVASPIEYQAIINKNYSTHPIFKGLTLKGDTLQTFYPNLSLRATYYKGYQGFTTSTLVTGVNGSLIGRPIGTPTATAFHEINTNPKAKYILLSMCSDNYDRINADGVKMIENTVNYLMDSVAVFYAKPYVNTLTIGGKTPVLIDSTYTIEIASKDTNYVTAFSVTPSTSLFILNGDTIATGKTVNFAKHLTSANPNTIVVKNGTSVSNYKLIVYNGDLALKTLNIGGVAMTINADSTIVGTITSGTNKLLTTLTVSHPSALLIHNTDTISTGKTIDYTAYAGVQTIINLKLGTQTLPYKMTLTIIDPVVTAKPALANSSITDVTATFTWPTITAATKYSLVYGKNGIFKDTLNLTALTATLSTLTPNSNYSFFLYASSEAGHKSLSSDTIRKMTEFKYLYYTDMVSKPVTYPSGDFYNKVFTKDSIFTFGTGSNKLTLYVPTLTGTQRLNFNNSQTAKTDTTLDYGAATSKDLGATNGAAQFLTTVGAYFQTPKVPGPARITVWVADGNPGTAKTTLSRKVGTASTYSGDQIFVNTTSTKKIYKWVYESSSLDSVQFKILPNNLKLYVYNIKVQALPLSDVSNITSFTFGASGEADTIVAPTTLSYGKINIGLPYGSTVTALTPSIVLPAGAIISPTSGVVQNFTNPVQYTVTAQDGVTKSIYDVKVSVSKVPSKACSITGIAIKGKTATIDTTSINVKLIKTAGPLGKFPVTFAISPLAKATINSGDSLDFSTGKATLKVTAQDGTTNQIYTINVVLATKYMVGYCTATGKTGVGATLADTLDTKIYPTIAAKYDVTLFNAGLYTLDMTETQVKTLFADCDLVFMSESVAGTNKLAVGSKYLVGYKPFLNSKVFTYSSDRWNYGTAVNGASTGSTPV